MKYLFFLINLLFIQLAIANTQLIKVGSTFDYPPVTYIESGEYQGYDIKIINDFAKDNHLQLKFVKTTWTNLSNDLLNNKFTIAVGGISNTKERQADFLLSQPINQSRKAGLVRCDDINKFKSLNVINSPTTIIVENASGTNEKFAVAQFPKAKLIIVPNNELPFKYLLDKKADIMFTDDEEIAYHHKLTPELCEAKLDTQFKSINKVFLFTKDNLGKQLQKQFNQWWQKNKTEYQ